MASTSAEPRIEWSALPVRNTVGPHSARAQSLVTGSEEVVTALGQVAALLKAAGQVDKFLQLREATGHMLASREEVRLHHEALARLAGPAGYQGTGETTDFAAFLAAKRAELAQQGYDAGRDPLMAQFDHVAAGPGAAEEGEEQIDDEIAIAGGSGLELGKNTHCPITGRPLLELDQPVMDLVGFVYDKAAILQHIKRMQHVPGGRQSVQCPVAGTAHRITEAELRPATAVLAAKARGGPRGGTAAQRAQQAEDVVDLDCD